MAIKEDTEIVKLAEKANSGDAEAQLGLASVFMSRGETKLAEKWLIQAAAQGLTEAQYQLGSLYVKGATTMFKSYGVKFIEKIESLLLAAAEKGHEKAIIELAPMYLTPSLPTYNLDKAGVWAVKAAELGNADSIYNLALLYRQGGCAALGTEPNLAKCEELLHQAADKKYLDATYALGELEEEKGTPEGDVAAFEYFLSAAQEDHIPSKFKVALCLYWGKGVEEDRALGESLLIDAAENGYEPAIEEIRNNPSYGLEIKPMLKNAQNRGKSKSKSSKSNKSKKKSKR